MSTYNYTFGNTTYFLTDSQHAEVQAYSDGEPNDAAFNKWLKNYVVTNHVPKKQYGRAAYWSHAPKDIDETTKMVTVKQSATTLMKVVNPDIDISDVEFDSGKADIYIPSGPAMDAATMFEAIDNTAGFAVHSAFRHTFSGLTPTQRKVLDAQPNQYKAEIYNSLETMRVNRLGLNENPGFADYIENAIDYQYNGYTVPKKWDVNDSASQLASIMAPSLYGSRVGDWKGTEYYDSKTAPAQKVIDKYINAPSVTRGSAMDAIESIYRLLDISPEKNTGKCEVPVPTSMKGNASANLDEDDKREISDRVEVEQETLTDFGGDDTKDGLHPVTLIKVHPHRNAAVDRIEHLSGAVLKADAQLRLRKTLDKRTEHYKRSGDLDEDELYRLLQGDDRIFMNTEEEQEESASIHFLIDASGSMRADVTSGTSRLDYGAQLAWLFAHSMNKRAHVKSRVWAHTGDTLVYTGGEKVPTDWWKDINSTHKGPIVYDLWQSGEPLDRLDIINGVATSNNYDGFAIEYVGNVLLKEEAEKKYLIVLSDGIPSASGYGGLSGINHVKKVTDNLLRKGIHVVQIAIGGDLADQGSMFKHFVMFDNIDKTIRDLAKILDKAR